MSQVLESPLEAGRDAVRRRDWDAAYPLLQEADSSGALAPEDLELLAEAALWGGLFGEYMRFPSVPPARSSAPIDIAMPTQIVDTSGLMNCIVS